MKHTSRFWWSCPACLKEKRRELEEQLRCFQVLPDEFERVTKILREQLKVTERRESA